MHLLLNTMMVKDNNSGNSFINSVRPAYRMGEFIFQQTFKINSPIKDVNSTQSLIV